MAEYIATSTPKLKIYRHVDIPRTLSENIAMELKTLKEKVVVVILLIIIILYSL